MPIKRSLRIRRTPSTLQRRQNQTFGGEADSQFSAFIGNFQSAEALNCSFEVNKTTGRTALTKRLGYEQTGDDIGNNQRCRGLGHFYYKTGGAFTPMQFAAFGDGGGNVKLYRLVAGVWTVQQDGGAVDISLSDEEVYFVQANNVFYVFNGEDDVWKFDGAAWTQLAVGTPLSGANNVGTYAVFHNNMLFVANTNTDPSRLYISDVNDPETFGANSYVDVGKDDGAAIIGLGILGDFVVVFKEKQRSPYLVSALSPLTTSVQQHADFGAAGCVSHRTIAQGRNHLYFMGPEGVYRMTTTRITPIHLDIQGFFNSINDSAMTAAAAVFYDGQYRLSVPVGASTRNNREIVFFSDVYPYQWSINTGIEASVYDLFVESGDDVPKPYFGNSDAVSTVYNLDSGFDDDGTAIPFSYTTKSFDMGEPNVIKHFKKFFLDVFASGNYNLTIEANVDSTGFSQIGVVDLSSNGGVFDSGVFDTAVFGGAEMISDRRIMNVGTGRRIAFRFKDTNTVAQTKIYGMEMLYRSKRLL